MRYLVTVSEIVETTYEVEAASPEDAAQAVADGNGDYVESDLIDRQEYLSVQEVDSRDQEG